VKVESAKGGGH